MLDVKCSAMLSRGHGAAPSGGPRFVVAASVLSLLRAPIINNKARRTLSPRIVPLLAVKACFGNIGHKKHLGILPTRTNRESITEPDK